MSLRKRERAESSQEQSSDPARRQRLDSLSDSYTHSDSLPLVVPSFPVAPPGLPPLPLPHSDLDSLSLLPSFPLPFEPAPSSGLHIHTAMEADLLHQPSFAHQHQHHHHFSPQPSGALDGLSGTQTAEGFASPPLVGLDGLPGAAYQQYPPAVHHDSPMSPSSAFGTPALSSSGGGGAAMSLSSSHDTLSSLATPATGFNVGSSPPGGYLSPSSPPPVGGYYGVGAEGSGLGLQDVEGKGKMNATSVAAAAAAAAAGHVHTKPASQQQQGHRRQVSTTRPPEVSRKGEDLGLMLGDFDMLDTLGTGTFGRVLLARLRPDPVKRPTQAQPHYFAMKVLEKNTIVRLRQVEHVNSERATLAWVRHPFVVNLFCTFQDESNLYLLLEYVQGGELFSHLRRAGRFSADVARFYAANLVLALENLHKQDIIYRDLKPENLLIDHTGHIKMTDFGFAKYVPERTYTLCGTPEYLAPEIITATGHSAACDWWALGVLLFELLAGYPPFFADNPLEIYERILQGRFGVPAHIDPLAKDLIRRLLTADLSKRLGNLKGGAADVRNHPWFEGVDWAAVERKEIRAPIIPLTSIPGDCSNFERFPQTSIESMPGVLRAMSKRKYGFEPERGEDPYGYLFPSF
ncbi:hypothetical protein JCM8547_000161 [Rhodosporidiobolus lusitaniae]